MAQSDKPLLSKLNEPHVGNLVFDMSINSSSLVNENTRLKEELAVRDDIIVSMDEKYRDLRKELESSNAEKEYYRTVAEMSNMELKQTKSEKADIETKLEKSEAKNKIKTIQMGVTAFLIALAFIFKNK